MEFFDDERPRFLFQGRAAAPSSSASAEAAGILKVSKLHAFACFVSGLLLLLLAYVSLSGTETLASLFLWTALSLLLAPFAPISATGGDVRVGVGDSVPDPDPAPASSDLVDEPGRRITGRRARSQKPVEISSLSFQAPVVTAVPEAAVRESIKDHNFTSGGRSEDRRGKVVPEEEKEWTEADLELLKKQVSKYPVGAPKRWERIAEAFHGRHGLDSVISTAKSMSEKRPGSEDSFQQFLKQRKPVDRRVETMEGDIKDGAFAENGELAKENEEEGGNWSAGEDIALLNALKAFPKDVPMRWEKISASVPGKSKTACMKRIAELKRDFRSSKASQA